MERVHLVVSGLVQGVFYRANTRNKANELGVGGWVCNLPDGRVEVHASGERSKLQALVNYCRWGPPRAHVSGIEISWDEGDGWAGFEIRQG